MTKRDQVKYIRGVLAVLKQHRLNIGWLQAEVGISRTHWHFLKKGERPLTAASQSKIDLTLRSITKNK